MMNSLFSKTKLFFLRKDPLNLNKIKLYCILHNVEEWEDVPDCSNCFFNQAPNPIIKFIAINKPYLVHSITTTDCFNKKNRIRYSYARWLKVFGMKNAFYWACN